ncbi:MAG TPA: hypothetical protein VFT45_01865 [Longimicrobium sp.]|nr:hypothetical protein [Longimicrobium sp.]
MKKLRLSVDAVTVESFATEPGGERERGTVMAFVTAGSRTCLIPFCGSADGD